MQRHNATSWIIAFFMLILLAVSVRIWQNHTTQQLQQAATAQHQANLAARAASKKAYDRFSHDEMGPKRLLQLTNRHAIEKHLGEPLAWDEASEKWTWQHHSGYRISYEFNPDGTVDTIAQTVTTPHASPFPPSVRLPVFPWEILEWTAKVASWICTLVWLLMFVLLSKIRKRFRATQCQNFFNTTLLAWCFFQACAPHAIIGQLQNPLAFKWLLMVFGMVALLVYRLWLHASAENKCEGCGYDIRHLQASETCPECGRIKPARIK